MKVVGKIKEKMASTSPVFKSNLRVSVYGIALFTGLIFTFTNLAVLKVIVTIMIALSVILTIGLIAVAAYEAKDKVISFVSKLGGFKNGAN